MARLHGDRNVKILKYTVCLHLHCGSRLSASSISMAVRNGGKKSGPSVCTARNIPSFSQTEFPLLLFTALSGMQLQLES